jgi:hypothetical protein
MATINGEIGSLEHLLSLLKDNGVTFLSSLDEIISFKQNYVAKIEEIEKEIKNDLSIEIEKAKGKVLLLSKDYDKALEERGKLLIKEKNNISKQITAFSKKPKNIFTYFYYIYKGYILTKRKNVLANHFEKEKKRPLIPLNNKITAGIKNVTYLENNSSLVISERLASKTKHFKKAKDILDENNSTFFGAIGEQKAVNELKKLPDTFTIINNFKLEFNPPIYNRSTDQRIYSIQADHIVIGPSGIFLIETKNWSRDSINKIDLYSPVEQIKRSNYALFCYLNNSVNNGSLSLFKDHWGDRKISVHNIILMVNAKPSKEFQYVKIVGLPEICGYITYFKPIFNNKEIRQILNYLM